MRWVSALVLSLSALSADAQTPQPFPRPGEQQPRPPAPSAPPVNTGSVVQPQASKPVAQAPADPGAPPAATVWFPVYPSAQFIASYDAGRGQRYYLYGTAAPFAEIVSYYRTQLDERGDLVFREPPTHMFEVGRFREETMAFPPGVTVKDWAWAGAPGYPNPKRGAQPARFPTIIMIVPPPPAAQPSR